MQPEASASLRSYEGVGRLHVHERVEVHAAAAVGVADQDNSFHRLAVLAEGIARPLVQGAKDDQLVGAAREVMLKVSSERLDSREGVEAEGEATLRRDEQQKAKNILLNVADVSLIRVFLFLPAQ
jgi:hypothetical protein